MFKEILVSSLMPDTVINSPVLLTNGKQFLKADQIITSEDLDKLLRSGIKIVYIKEDAEIFAYKQKIPEFSLYDFNSPEERFDVQGTIQNLVKLFSYKNNFTNNLNQYTADVEICYTDILEDNLQVNLNRIRNIAENIVNEIYKYPDLFVFAYPKYKTKISIYSHVVLVSIFGVLLCNELSISKPKAIDLVFGILLMDIGMLKIPLGILNKQDSLTPKEVSVIQTHPIHSYKLLIQNAKLKTNIAKIALEHQEDINGQGYPRKLKNNEASPYTKIIRIVDSFVAMLETKPYRKAKTYYEAMKELVTQGVYRYESSFLKVFMEKVLMYPMFSVVELNDQSLGIIVAGNKAKLLRPLVLRIRDKNKNPIKQPSFVHLTYQVDLFIVKAIDSSELGINSELEIENYLPILKQVIKTKR